MSKYSNLPIYRESYDLTIAIFRATTGFIREYKYTLGEKLKSESLELLINIYQANENVRGRAKKIQAAGENIEKIRIILRLLNDLGQINLKRFSFLNEKIDGIQRQLCGWGKILVRRKFSR